jgi:hypothetical protein
MDGNKMSVLRGERFVNKESDFLALDLGSEDIHDNGMELGMSFSRNHEEGL